LDTKMGNNFVIPQISQSVWLNELVFEPENGLLSIELKRAEECFTPIEIKANNSVIWDYSPAFSTESVIVDSQFTLPVDDKDIIWIHLSTTSEIKSNFITESFPIPIHTKNIWARDPSSLSWEQSFYPTMGFKNQLNKGQDGGKIIPELFALYQNYPNPFNMETAITFDLLKQSIVSLYILNATGHIESTYLENEDMIPGTYNFIWNGNSHSSGVYFVTLKAVLDPYEPIVMIRKMIYLK